jgi:hypothetical protein
VKDRNLDRAGKHAREGHPSIEELVEAVLVGTRTSQKSLLISFMTEAEWEQWVLLAGCGATEPLTPGWPPQLLYNCPLVTHNRRDFAGVPGLQLLD